MRCSGAIVILVLSMLAGGCDRAPAPAVVIELAVDPPAGVDAAVARRRAADAARSRLEMRVDHLEVRTTPDGIRIEVRDRLPSEDVDRLIAALGVHHEVSVGWADGGPPLFTGAMIDAAAVRFSDRDAPGRVFVTFDPAVAAEVHARALARGAADVTIARGPMHAVAARIVGDAEGHRLVLEPVPAAPDPDRQLVQVADLARVLSVATMPPVRVLRRHPPSDGRATVSP